MASNTKYLTAVGVAFVAGLSANALLTPSASPKATPVVTASNADLPASADGPMAPEPSRVEASRGWTDPVRVKAVASSPAPSLSSTGTVSQLSESPIRGQASGIAVPPAPPARPTDTALEAKIASKEPRPAHPGFREVTGSAGRRNGLEAAPYGFRTASYPGYAGTHGPDREFRPAQRLVRADIERGPARRTREGDPLMEWLSEPGSRY